MRSIPQRGGGAPACDEAFALVIVLLAMLLLMTLGVAFVLNTALEVMLAGHFQASQEAFYAADAGLERVIDELTMADWNNVLRGAERSAFSDGSPSGTRALSDASTIDLAEATNLLNCGRASACTAAEMDNSNAARPWGVNNPRWVLYSYGPPSAMVPTGSINSSMYVVVWVADDQSESDGDPVTDGDDPSNPGRGVLAIHSEAFGPANTHRVLEATVSRVDRATPGSGIRVVGWREMR
jgi:PilX N-terminal